MFYLDIRFFIEIFDILYFSFDFIYFFFMFVKDVFFDKFRVFEFFVIDGI